MLVSLPFVLLVLDVYPLRRLAGQGLALGDRPRADRGKAALPGARGGRRRLDERRDVVGVRVTPLALYPPVARVAMAAYSLAFYPWKTLAPLDLMPMYELPVRVSLLGRRSSPRSSPSRSSRWRWWWRAGGGRAGSPSWLAYAVTLAPVSGLIHAGPQLVADRLRLSALAGALLAPRRRRGGGVATAGAGPRGGVGRGSLDRVPGRAHVVAGAGVARHGHAVRLHAASLPTARWCQHQYGGSLGNRGRLSRPSPLRARRPRCCRIASSTVTVSVWRC